MKVCLIAPALPPRLDGVGDYCHHLWRHWPQAQPAWEFLLAAGVEESQQAFPQLAVRGFERSETGCLSALEAMAADTAILHYVGYGYDAQGAPQWLAPALRQWKAGQPRRRVFVFFHELYAVGPLWRRAFWTQWAQRRVVHALLAVADRWATSCPRYYRQLQSVFSAPPQAGAMVPVGANILPTNPVDFSRPWPLARGEGLKIAIFGLANTRIQALRRHRKLLRMLCDRGWVASITWVGRREDNAAQTRRRARYQRGMGAPGLWREVLDGGAGDVSRLLCEQDVGLLANDADTLSKSGVFAALAAHGVLPLVQAKGVCQNAVREAALIYERPAQALERLRDVDWIMHRRRHLQKMSHDYLSWPSLTAAWADELDRLTAVSC